MDSEEMSGEIYSIEFSVLVSTPERGPALISKQPAAVFNIVRNTPPGGFRRMREYLSLAFGVSPAATSLQRFAPVP